jgi:N6-adenosine-specific RNA methylase IME4
MPTPPHHQPRDAVTQPDPMADALDTAWHGLNPPYATIVVDPPWPYDNGLSAWSGTEVQRRALPYSSMSVEDIATLSIADLAAPGGHLYLWTTNYYLEHAYGIVRGWGFLPRYTLVWCKEPRPAPRGTFSITTEFVIHARRGRSRRPVERAGALIREARLQRGWSQNQLDIAVRGRVTRLSKRWEDDDCLPTAEDWQRLQQALPALAGIPLPEVEPLPEREHNCANSTWWKWKRGPHSAKPPAFLDLVEQVSPEPRVELFARDQRLGWDSWGWGYEHAV